jgi:DNA-directed RNA polymerase subunit RPC12/RpoP
VTTRSCSRCGTTVEVDDADELPAGWSFAVERERMLYQCGECVRANIRAIEGKLPEEYWEY